MFELNEIPEADITIDVNFDSFETSKTGYLVSQFKDGKKPVKIHLHGDLITDGINFKEFQNGPAYTVGIAIEDDDDLNAIRSLIDKIEENENVKTWEVSSPLKDTTKLYLKIPFKDGKFLVKSNVKLNPKKLDELELYRSQGVEIFCEAGGWYDNKKEKAGVFLKMYRIEFELDEPVKKKKAIKL